MLTPEDVWKMRGRPLDTEDIQLLLDEVERLQKDNEQIKRLFLTAAGYCKENGDIYDFPCPSDFGLKDHDCTNGRATCGDCWQAALEGVE